MQRKSLIAIAALSLTLGGCGTEKPAHPPTKAFIAWDDSGFSRFMSDYKAEIIETVEKLAAQHDEVLGTVLDGQPLTTATISKEYFSATGPEEDVEERREKLAKMATEYAEKLLRLQPETVVGSGQLQGLELAAHISGLTKVFMWTDAIVNEPANRFNLTSASQPELAAEIHRWRPRLKALDDEQVVIVGVGHGVHSVSTVERATHLFKAILPHAVLTLSLAGQ